VVAEAKLRESWGCLMSFPWRLAASGPAPSALRRAQDICSQEASYSPVDHSHRSRHSMARQGLLLISSRSIKH